MKFQTTEDKLVAMWSSKDEDAQGVAFARWKTKNIIWGYERNPNSKTMPRRERREWKKLILWMNFALQGIVRLVKRIPKEKTCPQEENKLHKTQVTDHTI